jgi:hypothetical protein
MRWRTYNRYVQRYDRYEDILEQGIIPLIDGDSSSRD